MRGVKLRIIILDIHRAPFVTPSWGLKGTPVELLRASQYNGSPRNFPKGTGPLPYRAGLFNGLLCSGRPDGVLCVGRWPSEVAGGLSRALMKICTVLYTLP